MTVPCVEVLPKRNATCKHPVAWAATTISAALGRGVLSPVVWTAEEALGAQQSTARGVHVSPVAWAAAKHGAHALGYGMQAEPVSYCHQSLSHNPLSIPAAGPSLGGDNHQTRESLGAGMALATWKHAKHLAAWDYNYTASMHPVVW